MKNRHGTPFEHNAFTFFVKAPIAVFREWHRHRIGFSYNEESGRYKQLEPEFYIPPAASSVGSGW
jgi:thymidylate synthase (FAD)